MNYYYDTEFIEGTQKKLFGQTKPTIDLISIGIVCEDNREYYAISKDFNLKEAWNRYDLKDIIPNHPKGSRKEKVYWIRENILIPIYKELVIKEIEEQYGESLVDFSETNYKYKEFKRLIKKYGKSNKQIAEEVYEFCSNNYHKGNSLSFNQRKQYELYDRCKPKLYGFYSSYDHVSLCWLFGKMIDLPKGFPMYTIDLKQILDEKVENAIFSTRNKFGFVDSTTKKYSLEEKLNKVKQHPDYPKQTNEHSAICDAKWNKQLHEFLNTL